MSDHDLKIASLGTARIGPRRELKFALEAFWSGRSTETELLQTSRGLRAANWARQRASGVDIVPSNDFSLYDQVLDTSVMVGAIPAAYGWRDGPVALSTYFAMARGGSGRTAACAHGGAHAAEGEVPALEMTKWFDTNYHYMVPELSVGQTFDLASRKPVEEFVEAREQGLTTRPVLLGPVTYLLLAKSSEGAASPLSLLPRLLPVYVEILSQLAREGATWVQLDEPCLVLDLDEEGRAALLQAYRTLSLAAPDIRIMLASYFGALGPNLETALALPVAGLHLDLARAPGQLAEVLARAPAERVLSLGIVDGRNVWRSDLSRLLELIEPAFRQRGAGGLQLAPSCSLLHAPVDLELENGLPPDVRRWLAFGVQKLEELDVLRRALLHGRDSVRDELDASDEAARTRRSSPLVHDAAVAERLAGIEPDMLRRGRAFAERAAVQTERFDLPLFPTTTIGSFPQTKEVRQARSRHAKGELGDEAYAGFLKEETARAVRWQEEIGIDVLVHGEFERNDMVQYFGERLAGFAFTQHGWVQSYGSRCVRPPIIFGDVSRPAPITVEWWRYAASLTERPMKAMLTGPVTILNWSFVRDDLPRQTVCRQLALALRDEVRDLEAAGASMVQIDEAALREGLPLRRDAWEDYLAWAVECFRLCSSGVADETQVHTHMCYSEFNDIIQSIAAMDADVLSIETSRSRMELLGAFTAFAYPNEIGPGVYDIHSPRVPATDEMVTLLRHARERLADRQIWVNPDCGLKTRNWEEVRPALENMVAAARALRAEVA